MSSYLFIGGSGRSGTSFLAKKISELPNVFGIEDVELKIFGELHGLPDLYHALVSHYGLQRSIVAVKSFRNLYKNLFRNHYQGQVELGEFLNIERSTELLEEFLSELTFGDKDHPGEITHRKFLREANVFIDSLYNSIAGTEYFQYRLEKTPHNLLHTRFLSEVFQGSKFIHISRDPRLVAVSLLKMPWGPDNIEDCVKWYASYHHSWLREKLRCDVAGIEIYDFRIEDFHYDENGTVAGLCEYLNMDNGFTLAGYDYQKLVDIKGKISDSEYAKLNVFLKKEVTELGYDATTFGLLV